MNFYTKNRWGSMVIAVLVILNLILLATIWYPRLNPPKKTKQPEEIKQTGTDKTYPPGHKARKDRDKRLTGFLEKELDFTQDQVDTFLRLREEHFQKATQNRRQSDDLRRELMELLFEDQLDSSRVEEVTEKIGQSTAEHEKTVFYHFVELMEVCDAEQKPKYKTLLREILNQLRPPDKPPPGGRAGDPQRRPSGTAGESYRQPGFSSRERREPPQGEPGGQGHGERFFNLLRDRLRLTGSQAEKIRPLIETAHQQLEKIPRDSRYRTHEERRQAVDRVNRELDSRVEALLTDRQKQQYLEIKKERAQRPPHGQGLAPGGPAGGQTFEKV